MADLKISQLNEITQIAGTEMFPVANNGSNGRVSLNTVKGYISAAVGPYKVNLGTLMKDSVSAAEVSDAIGGWDNLVAAINAEQAVIGYSEDRFTTSVHCELMEANKIIIAVNSESTAIKFRIINTDGTLSCSRENTELLKKSDNPVYLVDFSVLTSDSPTSENISTAIGGWDSLTAAINTKKLVVGFYPGKYTLSTHCEIMEEGKIIIAIHSEDVAIKLAIVNTNGALSLTRTNTQLQTASDDSLLTESKTIAGAINELATKMGSVQQALEKINNEKA